MPSPAILDDAELLRVIVDGYPAPTLIVDDDVRALFLNRAARQVLGLEARGQIERALLSRGGHLLHCVVADGTPEGCGRAAACRTCVIRNSVTNALSTTSVIHRTRAFMKLQTSGGVVDAHFLVSASAIHHGPLRAAILTLEDISEIVKLKSLLPICSCCRKVRDEEDYWTTVEDYFKEKADIDFSHGLCAECLEQHYPAEDPRGG